MPVCQQRGTEPLERMRKERHEKPSLLRMHARYAQYDTSPSVHAKDKCRPMIPSAVGDLQQGC